MRARLAGTWLLILLALGATGPGPVAPGAAQEAPPQEAAKPESPEPDAAVRQHLEGYLRYLFAWGTDLEVSVGPLRPSAIPGLYSTLVRVSGTQRRVDEVVLVSADGRYVVRGDFYDTSQDPFAEARQAVVTSDQPSKGPAEAPVTIVEYGDFQCSTCGEMYPVIKKLMTQYPNLRLVYKDFPLVRIHNWALRGAIAGQCAYQQSNDSFWRLHDYFYENQKQLTAENLDARLDAFATRGGLNPQTFRACRSQELTRPRVEASMREGLSLEVANTPTLLINGRPAIGTQPQQALERLINFELMLQQQGSAPK